MGSTGALRGITREIKTDQTTIVRLHLYIVIQRQLQNFYKGGAKGLQSG